MSATRSFVSGFGCINVYLLTFLFRLGVFFNSNSASRCSCRQASWEQVWLGKLLHQIAVILGNLILDHFYCVNGCFVFCFHVITSLLGAKFFQVKVWNIVYLLLNLYILEVVKSSWTLLYLCLNGVRSSTISLFLPLHVDLLLSTEAAGKVWVSDLCGLHCGSICVLGC